MGGVGKNTRQIIILSILTFVLTGIVLLILFFAYPDPPMDNITKARAALSLAGEKEAGKYAAGEYSLANTLWDSLMTEWKSQNSLPFFKRDFTHITLLSEQIVLHAEYAVLSASTGKETVKIKTEEDLRRINEVIARFNTEYSKLPLHQPVWSDISRVKLLCKEAEVTMQRGCFIKASAILNDCLAIAESCDSLVSVLIEDYFASFPEWEKWITETIRRSRKDQSAAIIVDKFEHKCYLYNKGKIIAEYTAEFGPNWIGDKNYSGDKATPEGKYFITKKLGQKETIYYKALLLNYPNEEDIIRFKEAQKNGAIPPGRNIGNLIEIHGNGGKGINWTDGCVALENNHMDEIFKFVNVGNPVIIVGSVKPLNAIL